MNNIHDLDFNMILATTAHDMKNSLFILLQSIENLNIANNLTVAQHQDLAGLHYQTMRINSTLIQLLALYRNEQQLPISIEEHSVRDTLEDVMDKNKLYINSQHKKVTLSVDENLNAYYDNDLITYLISDIFINALRYSHCNIILRAFIKKSYLVIQVEDDGPGYPEHMLLHNNFDNMPFNACKGHSGLGLLFAKTIAAKHKNKTLSGYISLMNGKETGGIFSLFLPN